MIYIIIILSLLVIFLIVKRNKTTNTKYNVYPNNQEQFKKEDDIDDYEIIKTPYKKKYLLTKNEWYFYKKLKPLADKYNLHVIAKVRLADLIEVDTSQTNEFNKYFAKIKSKHIDFALAKPENLEIKYIIELDDNSHNNINRKKRYEFLNKICQQTGYVIIRTYGDTSIIENVLNENN